MVELNFDANTVAPSTSFDPLPPAWYPMVITRADIVPSKSADAGDMLRLELEVDEHRRPEFKGRKVWPTLCINHAKQQTREIARSQLSAIAHAVGKLQLTDTDDLLGCGLLVKIAVVPKTDQYDAKNEAKGYKSLEEMAEAAPSAPEPKPAAAPAKAAAPARAAAPSGKPAWKK